MCSTPDPTPATTSCHHCGEKLVRVTDGKSIRMGCQWCEDLYAADVNLWRVQPAVEGSFTCRMCPRTVRPKSHMPDFQKALVETQLCLRCHHFESLLQPEIAEKVVRVNGRHYFIQEPFPGGDSWPWWSAVHHRVQRRPPGGDDEPLDAGRHPQTLP